MVSATRNPDEIKNIDALRLKKYIVCYVHQHWNENFDNFVQNAKAPVAYL